MKRIFIAAMAVMLVLSLFVLGAGAIESEIRAVESIASESAAESEIEASETAAADVITEVETAGV